jgi:hypothetical protein
MRVTHTSGCRFAGVVKVFGVQLPNVSIIGYQTKGQTDFKTEWKNGFPEFGKNGVLPNEGRFSRIGVLLYKKGICQ